MSVRLFFHSHKLNYYYKTLKLCMDVCESVSVGGLLLRNCASCAGEIFRQSQKSAKIVCIKIWSAHDAPNVAERLITVRPPGPPQQVVASWSGCAVLRHRAG